ncbi:hypothetical protein [Methylobacterium sp. P5_C11]
MKAIAVRAKVCLRVVQNALKKIGSWLIEIKRRFRDSSIIIVKLDAVRDRWRKSQALAAEVVVEAASQPLESPPS